MTLTNSIEGKVISETGKKSNTPSNMPLIKVKKDLKVIKIKL
jgi:hypothetical protein